MKATSWIVHPGGYLGEFSPLKLPDGTYTKEVTTWNLHHGSILMEVTP